MAINNRYEFMFYIQCVNGNPNGDPDMGNSPRVDPQDMHGYMTDGSIKRRIRNYVQAAYENEPGMDIIMRNGSNLNASILKVKEDAGVALNAVDKDSIEKSRSKACERFYDVRTFGAVLSTGPNAGQVRGPVQLTYAKSVDPILPLDISITRMCISEGKDQDEIAKLEKEKSADYFRTMGRKQFIPYGIYEARGFVSANLAAQTGFSDEDLRILFEAILNMYENDRSASKGQMSVISPLIIFKHVGTDSDEKQRVKQCRLGCAPAHKLFETVRIAKKSEVEFPRNYTDYECSVDLGAVPGGVDIGFLMGPYEDICWNKVPDNSDWLHG